MTGATTKVIYARVPAKLHDAVAAYADQEGLTLTGAVRDLLRLAITLHSNATHHQGES
jgi:antitoxin component of RelBE/YafQ-DinJ toxin-antitoxin module